MAYTKLFDSLNSLRPASAGFGEVVCIELFYEGKSLGYSKRKSIHVPPSSNAYWNWMTLRSIVSREFRSNPDFTSDDRQAVRRLLKDVVAWTHENELFTTYQTELPSVQYYSVYIARLIDARFQACIYRTGDREEFRDPLSVLWNACQR